MPSVDETNKRIEDLLSGWRSNFIPLYTSVFFVRGEMSRRIFTKGKNADGKQLPSPEYSRKPIYVDVNSLPNTPSAYQIGKRNKRIKSAYFPGGYDELKKAVGRPVLELTNILDSAFTNTPIIDEGENSFIVIPDDQINKVRGLEKKYKSIFEMTSQEESQFTQVLSDEIAIAINKALE